jgi:hypothetical protein
MNYDANSAVNSQVSGLFSGASIGKIKGCTFNIQYVTSEQSTDSKQPTKSKSDESLLATTLIPIKGFELFSDLF